MRNTGLAAVLFSTLFLTACASINPFAGISNPPSEPKKIATYAQTEKQVPLKVGVTPDGKEVIAYATERTYTAGSTETPEKLGFLQRIGRWIGGLSLLAIVISVVLLGCGIGWPFIMLARRYYLAKNTLKKVIAGVDDLKKEDAAAYTKLTIGDGMESGLSGVMNEPEKKLVKKLRVDL